MCRPGRADAVLFRRQHAITTPFRIAAIAAPDKPVEIDRRAAGEGVYDIFVEIGHVEIQGDLHLAHRTTVHQTQIETIHLLAAGVDGLGGEVSDLAGQRAARKVAAERVRQVLARIADCELGRAGNGPDRVLDLDVEPVCRQRQPWDDAARRYHRTNGPGRGAFGPKALVTAHCGEDRGAELRIVGRHTGRLTIGDQGHVAAGGVARAGIGRGQIAFRDAAEKLRHVGNAKARPISAAQTDAVIDYPVGTELVIPVAPEEIIV